MSYEDPEATSAPAELKISVRLGQSEFHAEGTDVAVRVVYEQFLDHLIRNPDEGAQASAGDEELSDAERQFASILVQENLRK